MNRIKKIIGNTIKTFKNNIKSLDKEISGEEIHDIYWGDTEDSKKNRENANLEYKEELRKLVSIHVENYNHEIKINEAIKRNVTNTKYKQIMENNTSLMDDEEFEDKRVKEMFEAIIEYSPDPSFWYDVACKICHDMESMNFSKVSSTNGKNSYVGKINELRKIDLLTHTYNLYAIFRKNGTMLNEPKFDKFIVLLGVILHDFGKAEKIKKELDGELDLCHSTISALYIRKNIGEDIIKKYYTGLSQDVRSVDIASIDKIYELVLTAVENHHKKEYPSDIEKSSIKYIEYVKKIDGLAREEEEYKLEINNILKLQDEAIKRRKRK